MENLGKTICVKRQAAGRAKRAAAAALCALLALSGLTACASSYGDDSGTDAVSAENTLVYGSNDYTRINPALDEHGEINALLFDGLTAHDGENNIVPRLAKSWDYDEAACTYTFYLRDDVTWHDGEAFTADDVKFTIEAIMNPANESENASNYEDVEEITVQDDYTITFRLEAPNVAFLEYMTIGILPEHLLAGKNLQTDEYFRFPIGTGPYKMESWESGQAISLVKNENYFLGEANIDRIIFKIVPDDTAKALQLKSGELDLAQVTPKDAASFEDAEGLTIYDMQTADYRGILYNFQNEYWQENADLIPAFSYALDKQAMVDAVLLGAGEPAYSPLQRNVYGYDGAEHYDYNPEKAREILETAGCVMGDDGFYSRNGERVGFVLNVAEGDQVRLDLAQIAAQQLKEVGVDVTVEVPSTVDWSTQEAYLIGWGSPFDADDHTYKVFGTGKGANYSGYSDTLVDKYLTEARQTTDDAERAEAYKNFQIELAENPAFSFICYLDAFYVADSNIKGITEDKLLGHHGVGIFWNVVEWEIGSEL